MYMYHIHRWIHPHLALGEGSLLLLQAGLNDVCAVNQPVLEGFQACVLGLLSVLLLQRLSRVYRPIVAGSITRVYHVCLCVCTCIYTIIHTHARAHMHIHM